MMRAAASKVVEKKGGGEEVGIFIRETLKTAKQE
jgi:hypothetical protein